MSDETSDPPKQPFDEIFAELFELNQIAEQEFESAPNLPATVEKDQAETYEGTSDHASLVEQLGEKEEERNAYKEQAEKLEFDLKQLKFNERFDLHELRRKYIPYLFWMTVAWLVLVSAMVITSAVGKSFLTELTLIALITTTTANVVGMFLVAARWLFPPSQKK